MPNHLNNETSPYLLQHAENPVDWYPWGEAAFRKAREEDKPVFLSIGYSTCHWCHVMAHESFEDPEIAEILNRYYISVKVDKEERPDIDHIYMAVCQAFTGSGGWPTSVWMTWDQKPFFAGTYFPKTARGGSPGLRELLMRIHQQWETNRAALLRSAETVTAFLREAHPAPAQADGALADKAADWYREHFDVAFGGFGPAPKFPAPHNLLFLLQRYEKHGDREALCMAEITLERMYAGGLFDHIGYGFCRYSTDRAYLVPHFEKMLCDNALLILAYCKAWELTARPLYREIAEKTAEYVLREMTGPDGGFYSAQDADSEGEEGRYYVFTPSEITRLLGERDGAAFCARFGITEAGNFAGKSIPNLLEADTLEDSRFDAMLPALRDYRKRRARLQTDDKILTFWKALMIAALCRLYRCTQDVRYLKAARRAQRCVEDTLCRGDMLFVSFRAGRPGTPGFLEDYAGYSFALLSLYDATLDRQYLRRGAELVKTAASQFYDPEHGGFYLYAREQEALLFRPKVCYDGAVPSGNSLMAYVLVRLRSLIPEAVEKGLVEKQLSFLAGEAQGHPAGFAMFLLALSDVLEPPLQITVVPAAGEDLHALPFLLPSDALVQVLEHPAEGYRLIQSKTTFYVCRGHTCLPPMDKAQLSDFLGREPNSTTGE